jgi:ribosomal protein L32E
METANKPQQLELRPDNILVISKQNARTFHAQVKDRIKEDGYGLFEYVETIKFFEKLAKVISGDSSSKNPEDKAGDNEFRDMIREEIKKYNGTYTTPRGVKFEMAETGTKYNFSECGDLELPELEAQAAELATKIKKRQEFLKSLPASGVDVITSDGEAIKLYPPSKTSTSSYKATLAK